MSLVDEFSLVFAAETDDGPDFVDAAPPLARVVEGVVESAYYWAMNHVPVLPSEVGEPPAERGFPTPGGVRFGVFRFPARSAGKLDIARLGGPDVSARPSAGMHRSQSVDIEVVLSGMVDIVLPGGRRRVLKTGSILVMAGVDHAWENLYDVDCTYVGFIVGASRDEVRR